MEKNATALSSMATARNPSSKMAQAGGAIAAKAAPSSVSTVSSLETVQQNDWQKVIKYDGRFEEGEFAVAEFASLQRYNLILIQNQLAKIKAHIALGGEAAPGQEPQKTSSNLSVDPQVLALQDTLHHYGRQRRSRKNVTPTRQPSSLPPRHGRHTHTKQIRLSANRLPHQRTPFATSSTSPSSRSPVTRRGEPLCRTSSPISQCRAPAPSTPSPPTSSRRTVTRGTTKTPSASSCARASRSRCRGAWMRSRSAGSGISGTSARRSTRRSWIDQRASSWRCWAVCRWWYRCSSCRCRTRGLRAW